MVEQGTHKPLVGGSNPPSATNRPHDEPREPVAGPDRQWFRGAAYQMNGISFVVPAAYAG